MVYTSDDTACRSVHSELLLESVSDTRDQRCGTPYGSWRRSWGDPLKHEKQRNHLMEVDHLDDVPVPRLWLETLLWYADRMNEEFRDDRGARNKRAAITGFIHSATNFAQFIAVCRRSK